MNDKTFGEYKLLEGTAEKLLLFILWILMVLTRSQWMVQIVLFVMGMAFLKWGVKKTSNRWKIFLISLSFIIAGTLGLIIVTGYEPFDAWMQFRFAGIWWGITHDSLWHACNTAIKAVNGMLAIQFAMHRFLFAEALAIARLMRLPHVFLELILLSHRYLFGVKQCTHEVMMAQRQRLGYRGFRTSLRSYSLLLTAVFIKSLRFSVQNYQAMTVRGYNGGIYQPHQWIKSSVLTVTIILLGTALIIRFSYL